MRLTTYPDYTLHVLTRLAVRSRDFTTISKIADGYKISRNHPLKVVHRFGLADARERYILADLVALRRKRAALLNAQPGGSGPSS